jgi:two-component system sensor histidine kinase BaeS
MKPNIFAKLFLALFLSLLILLGVMMASVQWSFHQGFAEYLQKVEEKRLDALAGKLARAYRENNGRWDFLRGNHPYWFELLRKEFEGDVEPKRAQSGVPPEMFPEFEPPPLGGPEFPFPPPPHGPWHPPPPPPGEGRFVAGRLRVLDANRIQVVGPPSTRENDGKEIFRPILHENDTVGWLGFLPGKMIADDLELAFVRQQTQANILIMALALGITVVASFLLARQILRPVRRIAAGAKSLAAGQYGTQIPASGRDELGRLAADFNLLARTLKRNEEARRQWMADISHELRTPLAILRSEIEALQDGVREVSPDCLRSLHAEVMGLGKLVDDLYGLSVYDLGAMNYRMEPLNPAEILEEAVNGCRSRFEGKNLELRFSGTRKPLFVSGDARRLRQLFLNLLENSYRYTDSGGFCEITVQTGGTAALIDFQDTAPAVPEEDLDKLFERLYRVDRSRSRELGGAGLGLAICKNIAEAHGGCIRARLSNHGGLWIRVELPLLPA